MIHQDILWSIFIELFVKNLSYIKYPPQPYLIIARKEHARNRPCQSIQHAHVTNCIPKTPYVHEVGGTQVRDHLPPGGRDEQVGDDANGCLECCEEATVGHSPDVHVSAKRDDTCYSCWPDDK